MGILVSHRQLALDLAAPRKRGQHGGARPGAGRKRIPEAKRRVVAHRTRPEHAGDHPVHVTLRAGREAAFLREEIVFRQVREALAAAGRGTFRVLHFSVQRDHVHLLVEADDGAALRAGLQGLAIRVARAVNRALRRKGKVWGARHHRRELDGPSEVRAALVYVLQNGRKHGVVAPTAFDPCSSVAYLVVGFTPEGDRARRELAARQRAGPIDRAPVSPPSTWLARIGWIVRGGGLLDPRESPRAATSRRAA